MLWKVCIVFCNLQNGLNNQIFKLNNFALLFSRKARVFCRKIKIFFATNYMKLHLQRMTFLILRKIKN